VLTSPTPRASKKMMKPIGIRRSLVLTVLPINGKSTEISAAGSHLAICVLQGNLKSGKWDMRRTEDYLLR
jgi:hypothetical protein